jgi:2-(1,2-epoxy-1,2-dihydrophenyl)acetyl-CoA isomerase
MEYTSPSAEAELVLVSVQERVATVSLNRPERANAFTRPLRLQLLQILQRVSDDPAVGAVVLTGDGNSFSAGQDLDELIELVHQSPELVRQLLQDEYVPLIIEVVSMPKLVVAAINGPCVGAGLGLALVCDLRIVSDQARFACGFLGIGLGPDVGVSVTLARAVGQSQAAHMLFLGGTVDAREAVAMRLAHEIVPPVDLNQRAREIASSLSSGCQPAIAATKELLWQASEAAIRAALAREIEAQVKLAATAEHREAVMAFLERRSRRI